MGRHSAADDDDESPRVSGGSATVTAEKTPAGSTALAEAETTSPRGRHSRADSVDDGASEPDAQAAEAPATESVDELPVDEASAVEASAAQAPTVMFRPYTGLFGEVESAPPSMPPSIAPPSMAPSTHPPLAEAETGELPAVDDMPPEHTDGPVVHDDAPAAMPTDVTADLGQLFAGLPTDAAMEPATADTAGEPTAESDASETSEKPGKTAKSDGEPHGTRADLALLRSHPAVRARAIAAVIVPFALYAIAMAVIGRMDVFLLWIWIPIIVAGIAFGTILDIASRKLERQRTETPPDASAP